MAQPPRGDSREIAVGFKSSLANTYVPWEGNPSSKAAFVEVKGISPTTSGGWLVARDIDLDEATPANIKDSAGQIGGWYFYNNSVNTIYVKLYNKATAPVLASDTPKMTIPIPAGSAANIEFTNGIEFDTGIGWATTTGVADDDTGAPAGNDLIANLLYI